MMRIPPILLCVGALLLTAAQDAETPAIVEAEVGEAAAAAEPDGAVEQAEQIEAAEPEETIGDAFDEVMGTELAANESAGDQAGAASAELADDAATDILPPEVDADTAEEAPDETPKVVVTDSGVAVPAVGDPPTREFMVGVWTEDLDKCSSALDFKADGTMIGPFPRWELDEGVLTMEGNRQKIWLSVVDKDTMQSRRSKADPPRILERCP